MRLNGINGVEFGQVGPQRARHCQTELNRAKQGLKGSNGCKMGLNQVKRGYQMGTNRGKWTKQTGPNKVKRGQMGQTGPSSLKQGQTGPSRAKLGEIETNRAAGG